MILSNTGILLIISFNLFVSSVGRDMLVKKYGNILNLMEEFLSEPSFSEKHDFSLSIQDIKSCLRDEVEAKEESDEMKEELENEK